jgi:hypothetical protein
LGGGADRTTAGSRRPLPDTTQYLAAHRCFPCKAVLQRLWEAVAPLREKEQCYSRAWNGVRSALGTKSIPVPKSRDIHRHPQLFRFDSSGGSARGIRLYQAKNRPWTHRQHPSIAPRRSGVRVPLAPSQEAQDSCAFAISSAVPSQNPPWPLVPIRGLLLPRECASEARAPVAESACPLSPRSGTVSLSYQILVPRGMRARPRWRAASGPPAGLRRTTCRSRPSRCGRPRPASARRRAAPCRSTARAGQR